MIDDRLVLARLISEVRDVTKGEEGICIVVTTECLAPFVLSTDRHFD
jgi:hypothetical protein